MPLQRDDFPDVLAGVIARHASIAEVVVEAALSGRRDLFREAVMLGGYLHDPKAAGRMVDELVEAHREHLPQFS